MNESLWAGTDLKLEHGLFHLTKMKQCFQPPTDWYATVHENCGAIVDTGWQRSLYAYFDAFLMALRSTPEVIRCCFGIDNSKFMAPWLDSLPASERHARKAFQIEYERHYKLFRDLPLSMERHVIEHRSGVANIKVAVIGSFGVVYIGGPTTRVPLSETPSMPNPNHQLLLAKARALRPRWEDFTIEGRQLFPECDDYLNQAQALVATARGISQRTQGNIQLTTPPGSGAP